MNIKEILNCLFSDIEKVKNRAVSAGTKFRLMALVADIAEVAEGVQQEVLQRVSQEAAVDVDVDTDFALLAEDVLAMELPEAADAEAVVREQTQSVNEALGVLSDVLGQVAEGLERHHTNEEFERLYEAEKRRCVNSGTIGRAKKNYDKWRDIECNGEPTMDDLDDYRMCKLLKMFEKGVFADKVLLIQRTKRYAGEVDFDQLDEDHPLKKTVYKHYAALRKLVDFRDGCLVVDPVRVGRHFYACRKDANAKANRTNFLKYMHKVELAQEEMRRLLAAQEEAKKKPKAEPVELNFFAPSKHLKLLLAGDWFSVLVTDEKKHDAAWAEGFVEGLMHSEWGEHIAREWAVKEKRLTLKCMIIGALKDAGVLKGSYNQIAKLLDLDGENPATLAKYLGMGKKQPYAEWIEQYVKGE